MAREWVDAVASQARLSQQASPLIVRGIERRRIVDDDEDQRNFVLRLGRLCYHIENRPDPALSMPPD
jgi:hypothetical protein